MPDPVQEVLSRVKITDVYRSLGGPDLKRRTRGPAFWRHGDNREAVSLNDERNLWHDFVTDEGGGVLSLVVQVLGGTMKEALRWVADLAGVTIEDTPLDDEQKRRWAQDRAAVERDLPDALAWRFATEIMYENLLESLKSKLEGPPLLWPPFAEISAAESQLAALQIKTGAALVEEYRSWVKREPGLTQALLAVGRARLGAREQKLLEWLAKIEPAGAWTAENLASAKKA